MSARVQRLKSRFWERVPLSLTLTLLAVHAGSVAAVVHVAQGTWSKQARQHAPPVDLRERIHHNQPLESLSKMSFAIIQVVIRKLEKRYGQDFMEEVNKSMKLIRYEPGRLFLEVEKIAERDRPAIVEITEYMQQHH